MGWLLVIGLGALLVLVGVLVYLRMSQKQDE